MIVASSERPTSGRYQDLHIVYVSKRLADDLVEHVHGLTMPRAKVTQPRPNIAPPKMLAVLGPTRSRKLPMGSAET
jgi:hypothetical protein